MLKRRPLFGGALSCSIPESWVDVADMRQVPDHQECWLDKATDTMLVVEIVEYQNEIHHADPAAVIRYFLDDLADANGTHNEGEIETLPAPPLTDGFPPTAVAVAGRVGQTVAVGRANVAPSAVAHIQIQLCVIRLPHVASELLVTLNIPTAAAAATETEPIAATQVAAALQVHDWSLFGG